MFRTKIVMTYYALLFILELECNNIIVTLYTINLNDFTMAI